MKLSFNPFQLVFESVPVHASGMLPFSPLIEFAAKSRVSWIRLRTIVFIGLFTSAVSAQGPAGSLLVIDVENHTGYARDVAEYSLLATKPGPTAAAEARNFDEVIFVGDIVSVNGRRVKGTLVEITNRISMRPDAPLGMAAADITRNNWAEWYFEILNEDGTRIGSIRVSGMSSQAGFGQPPPGQTSQISAGSYVVVGGNGAFLGARGYMGGVAGSAGQTSAVRVASMAEDPANRRSNGSGRLRQGIYIIPMFRPEITLVAGAPAIVHSNDYSLVTVEKPAKPGEILALFASGLGPTRPGVEPGAPFPSGALQLCNSPVEVLVNGKPGEVLYAGGYPGAVDRYQVNFRIPDGTVTGSAAVQLSSAWILGPEVRVPIQ
jgi:hypothetical protein